MPDISESLFGEPTDVGLPTVHTVEDALDVLYDVQHEEGTAELDSVILNSLMPMGLTRINEIMEPQSTIETRPEIEDPLTYQLYQDRKLRAFVNNTRQTLRFMHEVRALQGLNPEIAERIGVDEKWWEKVKDGALSLGRRGWGALDILLRNLDRGRGSIATYAVNMAKGASEEDAMRRAREVFLGSNKGWVWIPKEQGPSWKEFLVATGLDDDYTTATLGFGLDVMFDPLLFLGVGASRKGIEVAAHQILNKTGRAKWAELANQHARALGSELRSLPVDHKLMALSRASRDMRGIINSGYSTAERYLDKGGLKLAGMTLPLTSSIAKKKVFRDGKASYDYVVMGLGELFGRGAIRGLDHLGAYGQTLMEGKGLIGQKLGKFMTLVDDKTKTLGESVGRFFYRTNPAAGREWRNFKQTEYYHRLGYEAGITKRQVEDLIENITVGEREAIVYAMDEGTVELLEPRLQQVAAVARQLLDENLIQEAMTGILNPKWSNERRELFAKWVKLHEDPGTLAQLEASLPKKSLDGFRKVYLDNYIPHIYKNTNRYKKLSAAELRPRAPHIVEGFLEPRLVNTLREAEALGLIPEKDLAKILTTRLISGRGAIATHKFLEAAARQFGRIGDRTTLKMLRETVDEAKDVWQYPDWKELMTSRVDASGKLDLPLEKHLDLAVSIARERGVPPEFVAKLDDTAIKEFLLEKARSVPPSGVARAWKKYVEEAENLYDAKRILGVDNPSALAKIARDLRDPNYPGTWRFMTVGGRADPAVLRRVLLPDAIARDLEAMSAQALPPEFENILRLWDVPNFWWKRMVTVIWPAFHIRNRITNMVNSMADIGISVVKDRPLMWDIMWGKKGTLRTEVPGLEWTYDDIRELMHRNDILSTAYRRTDINMALAETVAKETGTRAQMGRIKLPGGKARADRPSIAGPLDPLTMGTDVALQIENADRALLFIKSLQRGMSPEQAARRVNTFLFDYDDLSRMERKVIRRVIPFWTWTKKNLMLQTSLAVKEPAHMNRFGSFMRALSKEDESGMRSDVERQLLPNYLQDHFAVRTETAKGLSTWMMNLDLPAEDLNRLWAGSIQKTWRKWIGDLNPYMSDLLETFWGQDFYSGKSTVQIDSTQKVYDFMGSMPQSLKDMLGIRQKRTKEDVVWVADANKWKAFMAVAMLAGAGRFYTTAGKVLDPDITPSHRIWGVLTGWSWHLIRPDEEAAFRAADVLMNEDKGIQQALRRKRQEFKQELIADIANKDQDMFREDLETELGLMTPEYPKDLEDYPE